MARTNRYTCRTCGVEFDRCIKCMLGKPDFDAENFCTKEHADIYAVLSKHGCNLITADEVLMELRAYNVDEIHFADGIAAHIERIKSEATIKEDVIIKDELPKEVINKPIKKNKKKW